MNGCGLGSVSGAGKLWFLRNERNNKKKRERERKKIRNE